jgi:hypothetical protein
LESEPNNKVMEDMSLCNAASNSAFMISGRAQTSIRCCDISSHQFRTKIPYRRRLNLPFLWHKWSWWQKKKQTIHVISDEWHIVRYMYVISNSIAVECEALRNWKYYKYNINIVLFRRHNLPVANVKFGIRCSFISDISAIHVTIDLYAGLKFTCNLQWRVQNVYKCKCISN